jgi:hypothetical protein
METFNFFCSTPPNWFVYASGFASLIALLFVILYFLKPCLNIIDDSDYKSRKIRIKCVNNNLSRFTIKDIQCDIVASNDDSFKLSVTLELHKDWITGICYHDNYVFKVKDIPSTFDEKKFIKVRILAINILGVKKFYQKVLKIEK